MRYRIYRPNLSSFVLVNAGKIDYIKDVGTLLFDGTRLVATIPSTITVVEDNAVGWVDPK